MVIQPDGKVVGLTSGGVVARYTARGTRDRTFRTAVVDIDYARALALSHDGKIVIAGQMGDWDSADFAVARLTTNGELDPAFGHDGKVVIDFTPSSNCAGCKRNSDAAYAVAVQRDGKIVAAGSSDLHGLCDDNGHSCDTFALVRFDDDGSLDRSFGRGGQVLTQFVSRSGKRAARSHKASLSSVTARSLSRVSKTATTSRSPATRRAGASTRRSDAAVRC